MRHGGAHQRRDVSEPGIIQALRAVGAFVAQCHGSGAPDLVIRFRDRWYVAEVKSAKGRVRPAQAAAGYPIVRNESEALALIGMAAR